MQKLASRAMLVLLAVLRVGADTLDHAYMTAWATRLKVGSLLTRA